MYLVILWITGKNNLNSQTALKSKKMHLPFLMHLPSLVLAPWMLATGQSMRGPGYIQYGSQVTYKLWLSIQDVRLTLSCS